MMLANDEPVVPTMREQIEGLMTDVQMDCKEILETIQGHPELTRENYEFLFGKRTALHGVYSRLRAILDSEN